MGRSGRRQILARDFVLLSVLLAGLLSALQVEAKQWNDLGIRFAGYSWQVKNGYDYPGRNYWSSDNVWLDERGMLHLLLRPEGGAWRCAELRTVKSFAPGMFRIQIIGSLDKLDPQIVVGLFLYDADSLTEIDIEFSRWGEVGTPNGLYSLYGPQGKLVSAAFPIQLPEGDYTTHLMDWRHDSLLFRSQYGHRSDDAAILQEWRPQLISDAAVLLKKPLRLHLNLWLLDGRPPRDEKSAEIIIRAISYSSDEEKGEE